MVRWVERKEEEYYVYDKDDVAMSKRERGETNAGIDNYRDIH